jgi:predicted Zn finger-like uncharacterized protein
MRLICPNCSAQYEVDEAVIPAEGRDVQCSNCAHTWFQKSAQTLRDEEAATRGAGPSADPGAKAAPAAAGIAAAGPRRREVDPSVLGVLREEAERERQARRAEGTSVEVQTDLALAPPSPATAPPAAEPVESEVDPALVPRASRRELLPDIEEINSTLRATSEREGDAAAMDAPETIRQRRSGFRRGFLTSVGLMVFVLTPYILAAPLSRHFPSAAESLHSYAAGVDRLRMSLESLMRAVTESLRDDDGAQG